MKERCERCCWSFGTKSVAVASLVFFFVGCINGYKVEKDDSKKINAEAYLYPENLWQLDYSTELEDVLENNSPTVHGDEPRLDISGDGRGYLKYKARVSSATLSTFKSPCFVNSSKCTSGLTYAFWSRIGRVVTSSNDGSYQLLSLKAKGYGEKEPRMKVSYNIRDGHLILRVVENSTKIQSAEQQVIAGKWYHVLIEYEPTKEGIKLNLFLNMVHVATNVIGEGPKVRQSKEVDWFLGKSVDDSIDEAFRNSEVYIDNLAIWKRTLSHAEKTRIYLAEFGKFSPLLLSGNKEEAFEIKWLEPYDFYSQINSYTIEWGTGNNIVGKIIYPVPTRTSQSRREFRVPLELYNSGVDYTVRVQAVMSGSKVGDLFAENKFTIDSPIKGSQVAMKSESPTSISLSWNVAASRERSLYTISVNVSSANVEEKSMTSKSLQHELKNLLPNTLYNIIIVREEFDRRYKVKVQKVVRTLAVVEDLSSSIESIDILNYTKSSVKLKCQLHPHLMNYDLEYEMTVKQLHTNMSHQQPIRWKLKGKFMQLKIKNLDPMTSYVVDVMVKYQGIEGPRKRMKTPFVFRIKDFYKPPTEIKISSATSSSLRLLLLLPDSVTTHPQATTHVNINVSDGANANTVVVPSSQTEVVVPHLKQYTEYEVYAATGDGETFGKISKIYKFWTQDLNECLNISACGEDYALKNCINTNGSFSCHCKHGYTAQDQYCKDINECSNARACGEDSDLKNCINTNGGFDCHCKDGYIREGEGCKDINECVNTTVCGQDSELKSCINTNGGFKCNCKDGYVKDGEGCKDNNECENSTACGQNSEIKNCINTIGGFTCSCKDGYVEEGHDCKDINECENATACGRDSELKNCVNTLGSFTCNCKNGYVTDRDGCKDVNECLDTSVCGTDKELKNCVNTEGGFTCYCKRGYTKRGRGCKDINECARPYACGKDSALKTCNNKDGGFTCLCKKGYVEANGGCTDINECDNRTVCGKDSDLKICINTGGGFKCHCKDGYINDEDGCKAVPELRYCGREESRHIMWPQVLRAKVVTLPCPHSAVGNATRQCFETTTNKLTWKAPDLSGCVSEEWRHIKDIESGGESGVIVANKLNVFVVEETLFGGDVTKVVDIMENIVRKNETSKLNFTETFIDLTSNLLSQSKKDAWHDLPEEKRSQDAGLLLETVDNLIESNTKESGQKKEKELFTQNVELKVQKLSVDQKRVTIGSNAITLPNEVMGTDEDPVQVAVAQYRGLSSLIGVPSNTQMKKQERNTSSGFIVNSEITSITLYPQRKKSFDKPLVIVHQLSKRMEDMIPHCAFWANDEKAWSDDGCQVFADNATHVTCHCYHLTSFVVLMTVSDVHSNMTERHRLALGLITTIGIGISSVALIASLLTFIFVRTIRSIRNTIHQHLVVALFIAQVIFLFGLEMTQFQVGCQVIAAVIHYFFLVAFFVMGLEGIVLYCMIVRVYRSLGTSGYGSVKYVVWCWVIPLLFILINLIIDNGAYDSSGDYCWLSLQNGFVWSFIGPVLFIILGNFVILCLTLRVMTEKAKQRSQVGDEIWFWMKGCCLLLSILGITWVVGIFYVDQQTIFFAYLFNVVNSLQGFSIFVFHCICDPRVRKAYKAFFCCDKINKKRQQDQLLIRTNTRSTRMFSNASRMSVKNKSLPKGSSIGKENSLSCSKVPPEAEVSLMSSPCGTNSPNDSFAALVGGGAKV